MIQVGIDSGKAFETLQYVFDDLNRVLDVEEILDDAATILLSRIKRRFRQEVTPDGRSWPESEAAKIRKSGGYTWSNGRKVTGGHTLFATGRLFHSIDILEKSQGQRVIATDVEYAPYMNYGKHGRWQFMAFSEQDIQLVLNLVEDRISKGLR